MRDRTIKTILHFELGQGRGGGRYRRKLENRDYCFLLMQWSEASLEMKYGR